MHQDFHTTYRQFSCVHTPSTTGKKHVALIYAGMSTERDVSISSAQGIEKALVSLGYQVTSIDMGADIAQVLSEIKPDVVFNALHGTYGEDGCLQGLLNILRIPYTHSGLLSSAIAFNKVKSKQFFDAHQMLQAKSILIHSEQKVTQDPMPRPYVIKPISQGSSVGVELVFEGDEFDFSTYTFPYGDIIVEQYIKGREMQVAVLNGEALGALEIQLINKRFYDYEAKYSEGFTKHLMPAPIPQDAYNKLMSLAKQAYTIMGCNGIARVEFIYDEKNNDFYLLEINTHPGFTPLSICPEIAAYTGISFDQVVEELLRTARYEL